MSLLEKAKSFKKRSNYLVSVADVVSIEELCELIEAMLKEEIPIIAVGLALGASKQGSYSAITYSVKKLYKEGYLKIQSKEKQYGR